MAFTYAGQYTEVVLGTSAAGFAVALPALTVNVYTVGTTTAVTLYTSRTKGSTTANPTTTDVNGNLTFYTNPGPVDIVFTPPGGSLKRITVMVPQDPAEDAATYEASFPVGAPTGVAATDWANISNANESARLAYVYGGRPRVVFSGSLYNPGTTTLTPYELGGHSITPYPGVKYEGIAPQLDQIIKTTGSYLADGEWNYLSGTVLHSDGTAPAFAVNTVDAAVVDPNLGTTQVAGVSIKGIGVDNVTYGIWAGAKNTMGLVWGEIDQFYVKNASQWGVKLVNFAHMTIGLIATALCQNGVYFGTYMDASVFQPCNSTVGEIYVLVPRDGRDSRQCRGIVLEAITPSGTSATLGQFHLKRLQVNGFQRTLLTETATFTNGSPNIGVADSSKYAVGMLVQFTTAANGIATPNNSTTKSNVYVVASIVDATHITIATSRNAAAFSSTGTTSLTINTYGYANVELIGTGSTSAQIASTNIGTIDSEGTASAAVYMENLSGCEIAQFGGVPTTTLVDIVGRKVVGTRMFNNSPSSTDFDSASSASYYYGNRGDTYGFPLRGATFDSSSRVNAAVIQISNGATGDQGGDLQARLGNYLYPTKGVGKRIQTITGNVTLTPQQTGVVVYNSAGAITVTLPTIVIDNFPVVGSNIGIWYEIWNLGAAAITLNTQSSQTMNQVGAKVSTSIAAQKMAVVYASKNNSGTLSWCVAITDLTLP